MKSIRVQSFSKNVGQSEAQTRKFTRTDGDRIVRQSVLVYYDIVEADLASYATDDVARTVRAYGVVACGQIAP